MTIVQPSISQFLCPENGRMVEESPLPVWLGKGIQLGKQVGKLLRQVAFRLHKMSHSRRIGIINMGEAVVPFRQSEPTEHVGSDRMAALKTPHPGHPAGHCRDHEVDLCSHHEGIIGIDQGIHRRYCPGRRRRPPEPGVRIQLPPMPINGPGA